MTIETAPVRSAAVLAVQLLDDEQLSQAERIHQVRALLMKVLTASTALSSEARAALDADPGIQVTIARITADEEAYYIAGPDGQPTSERFERDPIAAPVDDAMLRKLGF